MAETLADLLLTPDVKPQVVAECQQLVDAEVHDKGGASGLAIKGAFSVAKRFAPGVIHDLIDELLPEFVGQLEPYFADYLNVGGSFGDYLVNRGDEVSDALLSTTDSRANSQRAPLRKAYEKIRPSGKKNVEAALPRLGALIQSHFPA